MKSNLFLEIVAEWEYALNHYGTELPWKAIIINCTKCEAVSISQIIKLDDGNLILKTDKGEIVISPEHNWKVKYGSTVRNKNIFTHDLSN